jgi:hypothetical protein
MDDLIPKVFDRSITIGTVPGPGAMIITCEFIVRLGCGYLGRKDSRNQHQADADRNDHLESLHYVRLGGRFRDMSPQSAQVPA